MGRHKINSSMLIELIYLCTYIEDEKQKNIVTNYYGISIFIGFIRIHMRKLDLMQDIEIQDMDQMILHNAIEMD